MNKQRLALAMGTYAALALLAAVTLGGDSLENKMRDAVWVLLAGLALKTLIAYKARS